MRAVQIIPPSLTHLCHLVFTILFSVHTRQLLGNSPKSAIEASMAGKVKEKLMAISETLLCLAVVKHNPLDTGGVCVCVCVLCVYYVYLHINVCVHVYLGIVHI